MWPFPCLNQRQSELAEAGQVPADGIDVRSAIMLQRARSIELRLAKWAVREPTFEFDPAGTDLFSMMELLFAYAKRAHDFVGATRALLALERVTAAAILARSLIETVAMGCLYVDDMLQRIEAGDAAVLNARFKKFYAGVHKGEVASVHVNDALRHLEALDTSYFKYLLAKSQELKNFSERAATAFDPENPLFVEKSYNFLSEFAHPSGSGTQLVYPSADVTDYRGPAIRRLAFSCEAAIWQCHLLLSALERGEAIPANYKAKFLD